MLILAGCGGGTVHRPVSLEIEGFSARAETLIVKLFPESTDQRCMGVSLENAADLNAPEEVRWTRASGGARSLNLPATDAESVTLVASALDASGRAIQFACRELAFADIAEFKLGVLVMTLSRRPEG